MKHNFPSGPTCVGIEPRSKIARFQGKERCPTDGPDLTCAPYCLNNKLRTIWYKDVIAIFKSSSPLTECQPATEHVVSNDSCTNNGL